MPFAELPSSGGFQLPPVPRWEGFAEKAIDMIANRPQVDYSKILDKTFGNISKIMAMASPEAKLERELKMLSFQAKRDVYEDYKSHPDKYELSVHGPILKDPLARVSRRLDVQLKAQKLQQGSGGNAPGVIRDINAYKTQLKSGTSKRQIVNEDDVQPDPEVQSSEPEVDTSQPAAAVGVGEQAPATNEDGSVTTDRGTFASQEDADEYEKNLEEQRAQYR